MSLLHSVTSPTKDRTTEQADPTLLATLHIKTRRIAPGLISCPDGKPEDGRQDSLTADAVHPRAVRWVTG